LLSFFRENTWAASRGSTSRGRPGGKFLVDAFDFTLSVSHGPLPSIWARQDHSSTISTSPSRTMLGPPPAAIPHMFFPTAQGSLGGPLNHRSLSPKGQNFYPPASFVDPDRRRSRSCASPPLFSFFDGFDPAYCFHPTSRFFSSPPPIRRRGEPFYPGESRDGETSRFDLIASITA